MPAQKTACFAWVWPRVCSITRRAARARARFTRQPVITPPPRSSSSAARALHAEAGLQRAGRVVDAGVDHAAVVAGLVEADVLLLLEHAHRAVRAPDEQLARDGEAEDARADHRDVAVARGIRAGRTRHS